MMAELYIIYFVGVLVTFVVSQICVNRYKLRMTFPLLLLCLATAAMSWLGLVVLFITFKDRED